LHLFASGGRRRRGGEKSWRRSGRLGIDAIIKKFHKYSIKISRLQVLPISIFGNARKPELLKNKVKNTKRDYVYEAT
jgi:hypothetical protein